ncbi:hypothetical protein V8E36_007495 [Tilletia maclaganii]
MDYSPPESPAISRSPFTPARLDENDPDYARQRRDRALQIEALSIALGEQLAKTMNSATAGSGGGGPTTTMTSAAFFEGRFPGRLAGAGTPAGPLSPPPGRVSPVSRFNSMAVGAALADGPSVTGPSAAAASSSSVWPWDGSEGYAGFVSGSAGGSSSSPAAMSGGPSAARRQASTQALPRLATVPASTSSSAASQNPTVDLGSGPWFSSFSAGPRTSTTTGGGFHTPKLPSITTTRPNSPRAAEAREQMASSTTSADRRYVAGGGRVSISHGGGPRRLGSLSRMPSARGAFVNGVWYPESDIMDATTGPPFFRRKPAALADASSESSSRSSTPEAFVHNPSAPIGPSATPSSLQAASPGPGGQTWARVEEDGAAAVAGGSRGSGRISAARSPVNSHRAVFEAAHPQAEAGPSRSDPAAVAAAAMQPSASRDDPAAAQTGPVVHYSFEVISGVDIREAVRRLQKWQDERAAIEAAIPPEELPPPPFWSFCRGPGSSAKTAVPESDLPKSATRMLLRLYYTTIRPPDGSGSSILVWYLPTFVLLLAWAAIVLATAGRALADARRLSPAAAFVPLAVLAGSVCVCLGLLWWALVAGREDEDEEEEEARGVAPGAVDRDEEEEEPSSLPRSSRRALAPADQPRRFRTLRANRLRSQTVSSSGSGSGTGEDDPRPLDRRRIWRRAEQRRTAAAEKNAAAAAESSPKKHVANWVRGKNPARRGSISAADRYTMPAPRTSISGTRWSASRDRRTAATQQQQQQVPADVERGPRKASLSGGTSYVAERRKIAHGSPGPPPTMPPPPAPTPNPQAITPPLAWTRSTTPAPALPPLKTSSMASVAAVPPPPTTSGAVSTSADTQRPLSDPPSPARSFRRSSSLGQLVNRLTIVSPTPPPPAGSNHSHPRHSVASAPTGGPLNEEDEGAGVAAAEAGAARRKSKMRALDPSAGDGSAAANGTGPSQNPSPQFPTMLHAQPSMDELAMREQHRAPGDGGGKRSQQQLGPHLLASQSQSAASSSASSLSSSASWPPSKREYDLHLGLGMGATAAVGGGGGGRVAGPSSKTYGDVRSGGELWVSRVGPTLERPRRRGRREADTAAEEEDDEEEEDNADLVEPTPRLSGLNEAAFLRVAAGSELNDMSPLSMEASPTTEIHRIHAASHSAMRDTLRERQSIASFIASRGAEIVRRSSSASSSATHDDLPGGPLGAAPSSSAAAAAGVVRSNSSATRSLRGYGAVAAATAAGGPRSSLSRPRSGSASGFAAPDPSSPPRTRSGSRTGSVTSVRPRIADFRAHQSARRQFVLDVLDGRLPLTLAASPSAAPMVEDQEAVLPRSQSMSAMRVSLGRVPVAGAGRDVGDAGEGPSSVAVPIESEAPLVKDASFERDRRAASPLCLGTIAGTPLKLDLDHDDTDDSDEVKVQPVPVTHRIGLGIAMSDSNRSSGDTPEEADAAKRSREGGRRTSSSLSSAPSVPDYPRAGLPRESLSSSSAAPRVPSATDQGRAGETSPRASVSMRNLRDRSLSESASAFRTRDRTHSIAEVGGGPGVHEEAASRQRYRSTSQQRHQLTSLELPTLARGAVSGGSGQQAKSSSSSPTQTRARADAAAAAMTSDLRGLGIDTVSLGTAGGSVDIASAAAAPSVSIVRSPSDLARLAASAFGTLGHMSEHQPFSPSGGAAGTGFPATAAANALRGALHDGMTPATAMSVTPAARGAGGATMDSTLGERVPLSTETRSTFKFLRLEGPEDEVVVESLSQRASLVGESRRASSQPAGTGWAAHARDTSAGGPGTSAGAGEDAHGSNQGSFGRKLGAAMGLSLDQAQSRPSANSGGVPRSKEAEDDKLAASSSAAAGAASPFGFLARSNREKRWVIIRGLTTVVRSSAERAQDRIRAAGGRASFGSTRRSRAEVSTPPADVLAGLSCDAGGAAGARARAASKLRPIASIAANPVVLVLTLAVNVLTIGTLGAGMALSGLLLQATPALGGGLSSSSLEPAPTSLTTTAARSMGMLQASEARVGRGGAIFGLALGGLLVLAVLARLGSLVSQVVAWRCDRRNKRLRRNHRRRTRVAPSNNGLTTTAAGSAGGAFPSSAAHPIVPGAGVPPRPPVVDPPRDKERSRRLVGGLFRRKPGAGGRRAEDAAAQESSGLEGQERRRRPGEEESVDGDSDASYVMV